MGENIERRNQMRRWKIPAIEEQLKENRHSFKQRLGLFVAVGHNKERLLGCLIQQNKIESLGRIDQTRHGERPGFTAGQMLKQGLEIGLLCS